jgi:hypothetical protein
MQKESFFKRYQGYISAVLVSGSVLYAAFNVGRSIGEGVQKVSGQHEQIINAQTEQQKEIDKILEQQNRLIDIYLKGCGK